MNNEYKGIYTRDELGRDHQEITKTIVDNVHYGKQQMKAKSAKLKKQ
jgi:hypothetical protein